MGFDQNVWFVSRGRRRRHAQRSKPSDGPVATPITSSTPPHWTVSNWRQFIPIANSSGIWSREWYLRLLTWDHPISGWSPYTGPRNGRLMGPALAALGVNFSQTEQNFETALKTEFTAHATTRDRHTFVQQPSYPTNPRDPCKPISVVC
jgi:hypothetical protein